MWPEEKAIYQHSVILRDHKGCLDSAVPSSLLVELFSHSRLGRTQKKLNNLMLIKVKQQCPVTRKKGNANDLSQVGMFTETIQSFGRVGEYYIGIWKISPTKALQYGFISMNSIQ